VAVNWDIPNGTYYYSTDLHHNLFVQNGPLVMCPEELFRVVRHPGLHNCEINCPHDYGCHLANSTCVFEQLRDCAQTDAFTWDPNIDRIIGITPDDIEVWNGIACVSGVNGYTRMDYDMALVEYEDPVVTSHELGHTFGNCDEYLWSAWDLQNYTYGCPNEYPQCCEDHPCCGVDPVCEDTTQYCNDCSTMCDFTLCTGNECTPISAPFCRGIMGPSIPADQVTTCFQGWLERRYGGADGPIYEALGECPVR